MSETRIAIIDYGMGNLFSVKNACHYLGESAVITADQETVSQARGVILPGVGAFGDAMENLRRGGVIEPIRESISRGVPFLGICLGMQLLMSQSEEFGMHQGLGIVSGNVVRLPASSQETLSAKVPQVGWNRITRPIGLTSEPWGNTVLRGINDNSFMYFVHSFYVIPDAQDIVLATTSYGGVSYCSALRYRNVTATQFHPERSGPVGLQILRNFIEYVRENRTT